MTDERSLIEKILEGDSKAFELLVEQYKRLVSHIVFRLVKSADDRQDICQEVFVKVYQGLENFNGSCKLSGWIGRIAYNYSLNYLKKEHVELWSDIPGDDSSMDSFESNQFRPDTTTALNETSTMIRREIELLPSQYKLILSLYHLDELSYREIGGITELPEGTVKSYLFRARKLLRERLEKKYQPEDWFQ